MAEQNYEAKRALSSSATPQPLNKKSTLEYIVDPDGPSFLVQTVRTHRPHLCSPHLAHGETGEDFEHPSNPDPPRKPPSSPLPPRAYVRNSKWNPCHSNRFFSLEIEDDLENKDHYPCLPDLDKYLPFEDNPRYNSVTVESVPEFPRNEGGYSDLPSETPSLEASPAGMTAWGHWPGKQGQRPNSLQEPPLQPPWPIGPCNGVPG
ncbi:hypothetical protein DSO57_1036021 [Entomophthora muscae]|uniref:Uncharacterized protein n=1 Tax=Entomophthora muscae TaxID=34485 RepID=A0ACC2SCD3_9FUNG|nr:hypothetical protein DSO57_1036021 [Entomophthora muscae]